MALSFLNQPLSSLLYLESRTSNGRSDVKLHPAFEGKYALRTSNAQAQVLFEDVDDPSGEGRRRHTEITKISGGVVTGNVYWGDERQSLKAWAHVSTSNGGIVLH